MSLPSRERGLKFAGFGGFGLAAAVAPFTGAWIEIRWSPRPSPLWCVAPFTGAWIEIGRRQPLPECQGSRPCRERGVETVNPAPPRCGRWSLPSRERGLKLGGPWGIALGVAVAPFTGAWIEISTGHPVRASAKGRSLHGSVD